MIRTLADQGSHFAKFAGKHYGTLDGSIDFSRRCRGTVGYR